MAQFVLCVHAVNCPRYRFLLYAALYVWNMTLKLLNVPGSHIAAK